MHGRKKARAPADLDTLREWKVDGRVLPANPARPVDIDAWRTAAEIPGLFPVEPPPVQFEERSQRSAAYAQGSRAPEGVRDQKLASQPPSRNLLVETIRIYFR